MAFEAAAQQEGTQVGSRSPRILEEQGAHFTQNALKVVHTSIASLLLSKWMRSTYWQVK